MIKTLIRLIALYAFLITNQYAHSATDITSRFLCKDSYLNIDRAAGNLIALKEGMTPISVEKQQYLNNIQSWANSGSLENQRIAKIKLYSDPDFDLFDINQQLTNLINQISDFRRGRNWETDRDLLLKAASGQLSSKENFYVTGPYHDIGYLINLSDQYTSFLISYHTTTNRHQNQQRIFSHLAMFKFYSDQILDHGVFSNIASCHVNFMSIVSFDRSSSDAASKP